MIARMLASIPPNSAQAFGRCNRHETSLRCPDPADDYCGRLRAARLGTAEGTIRRLARQLRRLHAESVDSQAIAVNGLAVVPAKPSNRQQDNFLNLRTLQFDNGSAHC